MQQDLLFEAPQLGGRIQAELLAQPDAVTLARAASSASRSTACKSLAQMLAHSSDAIVKARANRRRSTANLLMDGQQARRTTEPGNTFLEALSQRKEQSPKATIE